MTNRVESSFSCFCHAASILLKEMTVVKNAYNDVLQKTREWVVQGLCRGIVYRVGAVQ
ncbi:MAG: hypothetical protein R3E32_28665 [Chitinophagales bacterium]